VSRQWGEVEIESNLGAGTSKEEENEVLVNTRRVAVLVTGLLALGVATGCGSSDDSSSGGKTGANAAKTTDKPVKVGIVGFSNADVTLNETAKQMREIAKQNGWETDYQVPTPAGSLPATNSIMKVMVRKGATMLITIAFDPVIAMSAGVLADGVIWANDVGRNKAMGEKVVQDFGGPGKAQAEILNLTFHGATPGVGRDEIIQKAAKENPGLKLVNKEVVIPGAVQSGRDFTTAWLASHPKKAGTNYGIYAVFDDPARGAIAALKQAKRDDVKVYSYDATPVGLKLVKEGWIDADVQNGRSEQAIQVMDAAKQVVAGKITTPTMVEAPSLLITEENVAQFEKDHPEAFKGAGT
jgi:ribose transport system substrate-binding protein